MPPLVEFQRFFIHLDLKTVLLSMKTTVYGAKPLFSRERGPQVGFTVGHLWSYPSIFFIGIPARTGHALTGENVVSFSEVLRFW